MTANACLPRPTFLKLGGAVLTRKDRPRTRRPGVLGRLAAEIATWPGIAEGQLIVAHGSGSFGHWAVRDSRFLEQPGHAMSIARVAATAQELNRHVVRALLEQGLPALPLSGPALASAQTGRIVAIRTELIAALLRRGLLPVIYGDAVLDSSLGGTVASTEALLLALAENLPPRRVILATDVDGVYAGTAWRTASRARQRHRIEVITLESGAAWLGEATAAPPEDLADVTGSMAGKVRAMLELVERVPDAEVRILSGLRPGAVAAALVDDPDAGGTVIRAR